jgi:hypothetical protein
MSVNDVATRFSLPDLCPSLADYLQHVKTGAGFVQAVGGHWTAAAGCPLPFDLLEIWTSLSVQIQSKSYFSPKSVLPPLTVKASPPSDTHPLGKYDPVLISTDPSMEWPYSGIKGMSFSHANKHH